ncbi:MAG TPA: type II secretion system protein [Firmicutes bacterium]|nr:type II secretion system protein [Bacillota bacterium]
MRKGFSLVEILVAMVIFSIFMVGVATFFVGNSTSLVKSEHLSRMSVVSEQTFETFRGYLMQEPSTGQLMFDSLWSIAANGDTLFSKIDTVGAVQYISNVILLNKQFTDNSPYAPGSRLNCLIKTQNMQTGKIDSINVVYSRHR